MRLSRRSLLTSFALSFALMPAPTSVAAQDGGGVRYLGAAGISLRRMDPGSRGSGGGVHLTLSAFHQTSPRWGLRGDASAHWFPVFDMSYPDCASGATCSSGRELALVGAASLSVLDRPFVRRPGFAVFAGPGVYWAGNGNIGRTARGTRSHTALGVTAGASLGGRRSGSRFGLEVRAHHFPGGLGEIRWLVSPALALAF